MINLFLCLLFYVNAGKALFRAFGYSKNTQLGASVNNKKQIQTDKLKAKMIRTYYLLNIERNITFNRNSKLLLI